MERATGPERTPSGSTTGSGRRAAASPKRPASTPARFARLDQALYRAFDALLDSVLLGFALWTMTFHLAVYLGLRADVASVVWLISCGVGALAFVRIPSALAPGGDRRGEVSVDPAITALMALVGGGIGVASATVRMRGAAWGLFAASVIALALFGLRVVVRSPQRTSRTTKPEVAGALVVLLAALTLAVVTLGGRTWNADDVAVLNRSVAVEHDGGSTFPLRDTVYSDEYFASSRPDDPPASIEPFIGTIARALPVSAPSLAFLVIGPATVALGVLALSRLLRALRAPTPARATLLGALFLLFAGEAARGPAIALLSAHQGKFALVLVVLPLAWRHALIWARDGDRRALVLTIAAGIAGVGLSSTALFLVPVAIVAGMLAGAAARRDRLSRLLGAIPALTYPLLSGLHALVAGPQPPVAPAHTATRLLAALAREVSDAPPLRTPAGAWANAIGSGVTAAVATAAVLTAWLALRDRAGRLLLLLAPLALFGGLLLPPVYTVMADSWNATDLLWRDIWILPIAAAVGLVASAPTLVRDTGTRRILGICVPAVIGGILLVGGSPVTDRFSEWTLRPPPLDVPAASERAAIGLIAAADFGGVVAGPVGVEAVIAATEVRVRAINPRPRDLPGYERVPDFHAAERRLVSGALDGDPLPPGSDLTSVVDALDVLEVRAVCLPALRLDRSWADALGAAGFEEVDASAFCSLWRRITPTGPTTTS